MAATSLGLAAGHETISSSYPPAVASCFYSTGQSSIHDDLAADNGAVLHFPPGAAVAAGSCFPELLGARRPEYYHCSAPQVFADRAAAENEMMNIWSHGGVDGRMTTMMSGPSPVAASHLTPSSRIGFRTRSEVDVLDDGFRWRKYGKKAVKSSPNPRNYYRCSAEGCGVKKRVERDRDDPRYVVTTYDGVHNHATPGCGGGGGAHLTCSTQGASTPPAEYGAAAILASAAPFGFSAAAPDVWGMQQPRAAANSSESSY